MQWHHHSNLPWSGRYDNAAGIVVQKTGERWLMVGKGSENGAIIYWNIDTNRLGNVAHLPDCY